MMAYTFRYAEELRDGSSLFSKIKASKIDRDRLQLAKELIERNSAGFDPKKFQDDHEAPLREVIETKIAQAGRIAVARDPLAKMLTSRACEVRRQQGEQVCRYTAGLRP
jgi:non-homologous end joining protein Ku